MRLVASVRLSYQVFVCVSTNCSDAVNQLLILTDGQLE